MKFVYAIPIVPMLAGLFIVSSFSTIGGYRPSDPDEVIHMYTPEAYKWKAEGYAARGEEQAALNTCASMADEYDQHYIDLCLLTVYDELDDLDSQIKIFERQLIEERAAGDSGALTEHVLGTLKEQRDRNR